MAEWVNYYDVGGAVVEGKVQAGLVTDFSVEETPQYSGDFVVYANVRTGYQGFQVRVVGDALASRDAAFVALDHLLVGSC